MGPSYDNGFGSFGSGGSNPMAYTGMPVGSTGDVIIGGTPEQKSRKGPFIIFIILAVLVIGGGVTVGIIMNNPSLIGQKSLTVKDRFNKLMNYVVSGTDSTSDMTAPYTSGTDYYFDTQQEIFANRTELYTKTSELMSDFMTAYDALSDKSTFISNTKDFEATMNDEKNILDFSLAVRTKGIPDLYEIISTLLIEGEEETKNIYLNYYDLSNLSENPYATSFKSSYDTYINLQVDIAKIYNENGCLSGNTLLSNCSERLQANGAASTLDSKKSSLAQTELGMDYYYYISDFFTIQLFNAANIVYGNNNTAVIIIRNEEYYV